MRVLSDFVLANVPQHSIVLAVTTRPEYEMSRVLIAEDWPNYGDWTVITGSHCSCYGFDDTRWDATAYTESELKKVLAGWATSYDDAERMAQVIWLMSGRGIS